MKRLLAPKTLLLAACVVLAGCGSAEEEVADNIYRGIYVSTNDCATDRNLSFEACTQAVNTAIQAHNETSPSYRSLRACAATEGKNRCERDMNHKYRPRLIAYLVEATEKPTGTPLYAPPQGNSGFRDAKNKLYLSDDLALAFSRRATAAFAPYGARKGGASLF